MIKHSVVRTMALLAGSIMLASLHPLGAEEAPDRQEYCHAYCTIMTAIDCEGDAEYCAGYFLGCMSSCLIF